MGLRDNFIKRLDAVSNTRLQEVLDENTATIEALRVEFDQRVNEAYERGFYDGNDDPASGDFQVGGLGYRRMSDKYIRNGVVSYSKALKTAWDLWQKSPIAKRVLAMKRDHLIGHKARPHTNDEKLTPILDDFWDINDLEKRSSEFTMQLFGFGEQLFPAFRRDSDGRIRLGYIDPQSIYHVVKHPENTLEDWMVIVDKYDGENYTAEKLCYRIIRKADDFVRDDEVINVHYPGKYIMHDQVELEDWEIRVLESYDHTDYDGSCFYTKVNAASNMPRGMSDLLQVGDWLDQADEVLFSLGDREQFADFFSFDVTMPGATKEQVRERSDELRKTPPEKGSVNVHTDGEIWQMHSPDLRQSGSVDTFRAILGLILGGMGFPVHWYGFGDDANRATAAVQADPTTKSLEHDQGIVRDMFLHMCYFAADQAEIANMYTPEKDMEITLALPEISDKDLTRLAAAMQGLTVSLVNAEDAGWITQRTAATAFARILAELDIHYDVDNEMDEVEKEQAEEERLHANQVNNQLRLAMQQMQQDDNQRYTSQDTGNGNSDVNQNRVDMRQQR